MRYQLKARVHSSTYALKPVSAEVNGYTVVFFTDIQKNSTEALINRITISKKVDDYDNYLPKLQLHVDGHGHHNLRYNSPNELREEMVSVLHYFESMGAFWFKIKSIEINQLEEEWIPESEEERNEIGVSGISLMASYPTKPEVFNEARFKKVIAKKSEFDYLTIPLAFYRSGKVAFSEHNYYFAFLSFFLFLDGLFSKGQFHQSGLKKSFQESKVLMISINEVVEFFSKNNNVKKRTELEVFFKKKRKEIDSAIDFVDFIVETRGELAHFSLHNSRQKMHLLNQNEFQPVAFMLLTVCVFVIQKVANEPSYREEIIIK